MIRPLGVPERGARAIDQPVRSPRSFSSRHCIAALLWVVATLASLGSLPSCHEDLPAPLPCPPPPQHAGSDCTPALTAIDEPGCFGLDRMGCLAGPRASCTCVSDECPTAGPSCFPDGDCPTAVAAAVAGAECRRLEPSAFGLGIPGLFLCLCGCPGCAAVCDGAGPVMGYYAQPQSSPPDPQDFSPPWFVIDIEEQMPDQGRLGIYLRVRGLVSFAVVVLAEGPSGPEVLSEPIYYVVQQLGTEFVDRVLFDDLFNQPYRWTQAEDRPQYVAIVPQLEGSHEVLGLFEVDCLMPFVLPP